MPANYYDLINIANYYRTFGDPYALGNASLYYAMSTYLSRSYYTSSGSHVFPASSLGLWTFYGSSPNDEWGSGGSPGGPPSK